MGRQDKAMRMISMTSMTRIATLGGLAVLLASCSDEPSASDISKAMNASIQTEMQQVKALTAGLAAGLPSGTANPMDDLMSMQVSDLEKIGCSESGDNAYLCDVSYTLKGGIFGKKGKTMTAPVRMLNARDGWVASAR
jgi:hypothetical protein